MTLPHLRALDLVLGLDVSLNALAAVLLSGPATASVDHPDVACDSITFTDGKKLRGLDRLNVLWEKLERWVFGHHLVLAGGRIKLVAIEGYGFGAAKRAHSTGEIGGVIKLELWRRGYRIAIIPPSVAKKFASGNGAADKNVMMKVAFQRWGFDVNDEHQVDGFCMAKCGLYLLDPKAGTKEDRKALVTTTELLDDEEGGKKQKLKIELIEPRGSRDANQDTPTSPRYRAGKLRRRAAPAPAPADAGQVAGRDRPRRRLIRHGHHRSAV